MKYAHIAQALLSSPWAIQPEKLNAIIEFIHAKATNPDHISPQAGLEPQAAINQPVQITAGIQVIDISGTIIPKSNLMSDFSGGTSVQKLSAQIKEAVANSQVDKIVLRGHTPGGSVFGIPEGSAVIAEAAKVKPVIAHADYMSASAGYWLMAGATEFVASPSAQVGSIGVIMQHVDVTQWDEKQGVNVEYIYSGKYKSEGNSHEPLSEDGREFMRAQCDEYYKMFVDHVAKGRGVKSSEVVNGFGQARMLTAKAAKSEGMIDRVETFDAMIARISKRSSRANVRRAQLQQKQF